MKPLKKNSHAGDQKGFLGPTESMEKALEKRSESEKKEHKDQ